MPVAKMPVWEILARRPAHLSCFHRDQGFRNRLCQYRSCLFRQLRDGATGFTPQRGSQRHSAGGDCRIVHNPGVRLAFRPLRPQVDVYRGLPFFDRLCLPDVLVVSNSRSSCHRNHDRCGGQFRTGHHVRTGSGLGRGTLPRAVAVQRSFPRVPTGRCDERWDDTGTGVISPPVDRGDVVDLGQPDRSGCGDARRNHCGA